MKKTKVLIVDDEEDICTLLCITLSKHNYECLSANSGDEALKLLVKERPAVVLLDILLGIENGIDILKKIKNVDNEVKVIMLTVMDDEKSIHDSKVNGADDFVPKLSAAESLGEEVIKKLSLLSIKRKITN
ncbi:MAG: response regulator [Candidatus Omnitrophica bacterium]|nr:response regulator [Candidatus Omnitrophota bacterium]